MPKSSCIEPKCTFYKWFDPDTNEKEGKLLLKNCSSCHMTYYNEWKSDKHSMSQNNPFFLSIYSGTDKDGRKNIYPGFKLDHPNKNGNCSLCHNPEAALDSRDTMAGRLYDVDLREAKKTNGISCDFCHKIEDIDQNPLKKGVEGLKILRTCKEFKDIRFGPIKDPVQISNKEELRYNSLYKTSLSCAKCHDGSNGNVQIYSTFTEWLKSPAAKRGVQCQSCHMQPRTNSHAIVDNPDIKHKTRPYYQVHSHSFLTEDPREFRKKYVDLKVDVETLRRNVSGAMKEILVIKVTVSNNNFGHSFPTGSPMRNAILLLEIKDKNGKNLKQIKGPKLPIYAGDLNGKSGRLFAKILSETSSEYARVHGEEGGISFRKLASELGIPAQDWWNVFILNDTRIKANESDVSVYEFEMPQNNGRVEITSTLRWRNTWPGLATIKGCELTEDLIIEKRGSI